MLIDKHGRERVIDESAAPIRRHNGATIGVVLVFRDVTDSRAVQESVKNNEERLRLALEAGRMGAWEWNIASGQVIAGYTGTMHRATYTCVGDTVNLAARLESQTKVLGEMILIDQQTRAGLDETITVIEKGEIEIKGKTHPVRVYAVPPKTE